MSTGVRTPRKPKLYVTMADASLHLLLQVRKKFSMRNKLNDE